MGFAPGTRIGPYEVVGPLGAGGMGEVYRACDTNLDRDVALKLLPEAFAHDAKPKPIIKECHNQVTMVRDCA